jgi:hypothetical protein
MATVIDLARPYEPTDVELAKPNRNIAGSPVGTTTQQYAGEIVLDTTNNMTWISTGPLNTQWTPYFLSGG